MKNIHLIPTDNKPSRLYFNVNDKEFQICEIEKPSTILKPNRHIYITSDEEIISNCWIINIVNGLIYKIYHGSHFKDDEHQQWRKIILTTDQDLIKDGVQAIDDEFLKWFVRNPSCEEVEISSNWHMFSNKDAIKNYGIIIPKEEPKQDKIMERFIANAKQETLEEAAEKLQKDKYGIFISKDADVKGQLVIDTAKAAFLSGMIEGAKWQQERSYSEEDMREAYFSAIKSTGEGWNGEYANGNNPNIEEKFTEGFEEWFEQFKKK